MQTGDVVQGDDKACRDEQVDLTTSSAFADESAVSGRAPGPATPGRLALRHRSPFRALQDDLATASVGHNMDEAILLGGATSNAAACLTRLVEANGQDALRVVACAQLHALGPYLKAGGVVW